MWINSIQFEDPLTDVEKRTAQRLRTRILEPPSVTYIQRSKLLEIRAQHEMLLSKWQQCKSNSKTTHTHPNREEEEWEWNRLLENKLHTHNRKRITMQFQNQLFRLICKEMYCGLLIGKTKQLYIVKRFKLNKCTFF